MNVITEPWPWYIVGPLMGLIVPILLIVDNKSFGISSSLRQICACVMPAKIPFLTYDWKKEIWNLYFVAGLIIGGFVCAQFMNDTTKLKADIANIQTVSEFQLEESKGLAPAKFSSKEFLLSWPGLVMMIGGGFLIGFGSRYAGGCTSGHAIMGLSNLQLASLLSVVGFFIGGLIMVHFLLPLILK